MMYSEIFDLEAETVMEAFDSRNELVIREVLAQFEGLDVHKVCQNGTTLACAAVKYGNLDILKIILGDMDSDSENQVSQQKRPRKEDSDVGFPDPTYFGCYYRSSFEADQTSLSSYDTPGKIFHLDKFGKNVLHYALICNFIEMVEYLLSNFKELRIDQCDECLNSPLHIAVSKDNVQMVRLLLSFGASIDLKDCEGKTPLHIASERGSTDIIRTLLEANANVNALDHRGQSTLMLATIYNHCSTVELLIENGVKVNYEDDQGFTALRRAVFVKNSLVTKILVTNGARICESLDLLHLAVVNNQFNIVQALLDGGARMESQNSMGFTPLMVAVEHKNYEMTKFLLERGANPNTFNWLSGTTSLHLSMFEMMEMGVIEPFLDVLVKHGADIYLKCRYGFNALYYAFSHKNEIAACHLIKHGMNIHFRHKDAPCDYLTSSIRHCITARPTKLLLLAGFDVSTYEEYDARDYTPEKLRDLDEKKMCVYRHRRTLFTLKEYCRAQVRRVYRHEDIEKLPIPRALQKFVRLDHVKISKL